MISFILTHTVAGGTNGDGANVGCVDGDVEDAPFKKKHAIRELIDRDVKEMKLIERHSMTRGFDGLISIIFLSFVIIVIGHCWVVVWSQRKVRS